MKLNKKQILKIIIYATAFIGLIIYSLIIFLKFTTPKYSCNTHIINIVYSIGIALLVDVISVGLNYSLLSIAIDKEETLIRSALFGLLIQLIIFNLLFYASTI